MNQGYNIPVNTYKINNSTYGYPTYSTNASGSDERLIGGAAFPFLLGGVTGAALAPAFWGPGYGYNRPYYPGPYYGYPPRRWF